MANVKTVKIRESVVRKQLGVEPHKKQEEIIEAYKNPNIRDIIVVGGRRSGKSFISTYLTALETLKPKRKIWIVAPTSELAQRVYAPFQELMAKMYSPGVVKYLKKPYEKAVFPNGSVVECKTADNPVSLLGEAVDLLIIDEARTLRPEIYERYLYATTSTTNGRSVIISSPKGKDWFYKKYMQAAEREDGIAMHFPTSANPHIPLQEIERAREMLPEETFRQEYLAEFLDSAATVFRKVGNCVRDCLKDPIKGHNYIIGADLAKYKDFNVYVVVDRHTHEVVYFDRTQGVDWVLQKQRLVMLAERYNKARVYIDATGLGSPIVDDLRHAGVFVEPYVFTNKSKKDLVEKLIVFIEQQSVFIPNEPHLLDELSIFSREITPSGNEIYEAPPGAHDDCVIGLALAVWGLYSISLIEEKIKKPIDIFEEDLRPTYRGRRTHL